MIKTSLTLTALFVSTAVLADSPAPAQQAKDMERIIVTGSRVEERIDEVTASVVIVDQQALLRNMEVTNELQSILAIQVPGMGPNTGTNSSSGQNLRGRSALVLIDGLPQSTPLRNGRLAIRSLDPSVIERVEVIKGATSIYGNGAAGGIINYITKSADSKDGFNGKLNLATNFSATDFEDSLGKRADVTIDGRSNKLSFVANVAFEDNGIIKDADGDALGLLYGMSGFESKNAFTKLAYDLTDQSALSLTYNYFEGQQEADYISTNKNVNLGEKSYATKNTTGEKAPGDPQGPRGNHNLKLQYEHADIFTDTLFTGDVYWQKLENVFFYSTKFRDPALGLAGGQSMIESEKTGVRANFNTTFDFDNTAASFTYGVDLLNDTTAQSLVDGRAWTPKMDMDNAALYLQSKFVINDDWVVKAGLRHEEIDVAVEDFKTLMVCRKTCSDVIDVEGGNIEYSATTYNIGLRFNAIDAFMPFISYSEGFDVTDLGRTLRTADTPSVKKIDTDASIIKNYEIGFDGNSGIFNYQFATFISQSDIGTSLVEDPATGKYESVRSPQEIYGFEAALEAQATDNIKLGVNYSWLEGKNTDTDEYLNGSTINPPKLAGYADISLSDDWQMSVTLMHVGSRDRFEKVGDVYTGTNGPVSSYQVVNLSTSYQINQAFKVYGGVENLLNQDYYPARSQSYTGNGYNVKGKGATVNIGMNYFF
ncbi:TonB-dependent receptor [Pseudoalteromonas piratica]|uniref:Ligand-gated channel protein n=1 Tax=Pseudoalteromonas piratica TaxID=1348114 RepID=A0A0A7ELA1_9GAMM|nr:TonB-dependent receptor [Pseudoalteromonas piratica]AIY67318.1 ligand-gated channel protein [Pseudoalteromonas piratica]